MLYSIPLKLRLQRGVAESAQPSVTYLKLEGYVGLFRWGTLTLFRSMWWVLPEWHSEWLNAVRSMHMNALLVVPSRFDRYRGSGGKVYTVGRCRLDRGSFLFIGLGFFLFFSFFFFFSLLDMTCLFTVSRVF